MNTYVSAQSHQSAFVKHMFSLRSVLILLFLFSSLFFSVPAAQAFGEASSPASAVTAMRDSVNSADADRFESCFDISSIARHVFKELETMGNMPEYSSQMPPILAMMTEKKIFTNPVTSEVLLSEVRSFVRYGVGSGAFAGKKTNNYKADGMLAPLFSLLSMGRKEITEIGAPVQTQEANKCIVPFAVIDHDNGHTYRVRAVVTANGQGGWKITDIQNVRFLIHQILLEAASQDDGAVTI